MTESAGLDESGTTIASGDADRDAVVEVEVEVDVDAALSWSTGHRARDRGIVVALAAVALAPFVAAVITRWGRPYLPVQDFAVIDLRVRDVFSHDIPLVGPYSRYGWDHPGPMVYWLVAPFAALFGSPAWATQVGFVLLQAVAVGWTAVVSWRRRGLGAAALWLAVMTATVVAVGPTAILEPWGPNVALPFFVLFASLVWLIGGDEVGLLPQAAAVGSFLVQTHVGYAPLAVAGVVFVVPAVRRAAGGTWRGVVRLAAVRWAALVAVVLWLPALVDTVRYPPGNLVRAVDRTVLQPTGPKVGIGTALGLLAAPFRLLPGWLGGTTLADDTRLVALPAAVGWLLLPVVLLGVTGVVARRVGDRDGFRLVGLTALLLAAGLVGLTSVQGPPFPYLVYWREALGALTVFGSIAVLIRAAASATRRPPVALAVPVLATVVIVLGSLSVTRQVAATPEVFDRFGPVTQDLVDQLEASGQPTAPVLVRVAGTALGGVHGGVLDELARRGAPVRVDDGQPFQYGHDRTATSADVDTIWYVVEESDVVSLLSAVPGAEVVAQHQPLSPEAHDRLTALQRQIAAQLTAAGRPDLVGKLASPLVGFALDGVPGVVHADVDELAGLNQQIEDATCECAVIAVPSSYQGPIPGSDQPPDT